MPTDAPTDAEATVTAAPQVVTPPHPRPLKPRRWLFYGLLAGFAVWMAFLLWMYFTTEYPSHL